MSVLFIVASLSVSTTAFAATPAAAKAGWNGDAHAGPSGVSVRSNDTISVTNNVTVLAEGAAKVTINFVTNIYHSIFSR